MINYEMRKIGVFKSADTMDSYGQKVTIDDLQKEIFISISVYEQTSKHTSPVYLETTHLGITKEKGLTNSHFLKRDGKMYKILKVRETMKNTVCLLREETEETGV